MGEVDVHALRGVDLEVHEGEFLVLLGPSGSGKSSLPNQLGALDSPSSGSLLYRGVELVEASEAELTRHRRDHAGFVCQLYNLIPSLTAEENVALVAELSPSPLTARDALALVGHVDRAHHFLRRCPAESSNE